MTYDWYAPYPLRAHRRGARLAHRLDRRGLRAAPDRLRQPARPAAILPLLADLTQRGRRVARGLDLLRGWDGTLSAGSGRGGAVRGLVPPPPAPRPAEAGASAAGGFLSAAGGGAGAGAALGRLGGRSPGGAAAAHRAGSGRRAAGAAAGKSRRGGELRGRGCWVTTRRAGRGARCTVPSCGIRWRRCCAPRGRRARPGPGMRGVPGFPAGAGWAAAARRQRGHGRCRRVSPGLPPERGRQLPDGHRRRGLGRLGGDELPRPVRRSTQRALRGSVPGWAADEAFPLVCGRARVREETVATIWLTPP